MPRIPVRTTPYHTLPRCTRHYKSKRDLILRALGKASFINGSQFVIAWISPKGEVDVYASELLQASVSAKEGGVLERKQLEREAQRIRGEMGKRWDEIRRLEEKGEALTMEDEIEGVEENEGEAEVEEDVEELDPDMTLVEEGSASDFVLPKRQTQTPVTMMSTFAGRASTPSPPMHTLSLDPNDIDTYYSSRFAALQQATCKLVVKAWIKVIEPKKQMKFPYNKGEELKPTWWPEGVRHREPDHLSKTERLTLLCSIVRSPLITASRLELSTAEAAAFISRPRQAILREVYLVAKEEERRRQAGDTSPELVVHMPNLPVSPSAISPDLTEKRQHSQVEPSEEKENLHLSIYGQYPSSTKRSKHQHTQPHLHHPQPTQHIPRAILAPTTQHYETPLYAQQPFTYAPVPQSWREVSLTNSNSHLSPYPHSGSEMGYGSEYSRSPNPEMENRSYHPNHLAPILSHHHQPSHSPIPIPTPDPTSAGSVPNTANSGYFTARNGGAGYLQQQQMEYMQQHGHQAQEYDYGSPYLADPTWASQEFTQAQ